MNRRTPCPGQKPVRASTREELALIRLDPLPRRLILAALLYLVLGGAAGLIPFWMELFSPYQFKAHIHLVTLGFLTFMIYGQACHMLPRFCGTRMPENWRTRGMELLAHSGLLLQSWGWLSDNLEFARVGAICSWLGFLLFTALIWPLLDQLRANQRASCG